MGSFLVLFKNQMYHATSCLVLKFSWPVSSFFDKNDNFKKQCNVIKAGLCGILRSSPTARGKEGKFWLESLSVLSIKLNLIVCSLVLSFQIPRTEKVILF